MQPCWSWSKLRTAPFVPFLGPVAYSCRAAITETCNSRLRSVCVFLKPLGPIFFYTPALSALVSQCVEWQQDLSTRSFNSPL